MGCASDEEYPPLDYEDDDGTVPERQVYQPVVVPAVNAFDIVADQPPVPLAEDLLEFADACCENFALSDESKQDVLNTATLPLHFLMIRLYARAASLGQQMQKSVAAAFLESADFKEHLTRRLQAGLLDPKIPHYVRGTSARFVRHMIENPAAYHIPPAVQVHFIHSKAFFKAVGNVLSGFRGEMKRKIQKSITDKQDIATYVNKLVIRGLHVSNEHILQFSFLRMYLIEYNERTVGPSAIKLSYWEFMDSKMEKMRTKSVATRLRSYQANLTRDKARFPPPASGAPDFPQSARVPQWQADVSQSLLAMAGYHIDAAQDGDDGIEGDFVPGSDQDHTTDGQTTGERTETPGLEEEDLSTGQQTRPSEGGRDDSDIERASGLAQRTTGNMMDVDTQNEGLGAPTRTVERIPASTTTRSPARRGASRDIFGRGSSTRGSPIPSARQTPTRRFQTPNRRGAASGGPARSRVAGISSGLTAPQSPSQVAGSTYNPVNSETASATMAGS